MNLVINKRLWVDDLRPPPNESGWFWAQTVNEAIWYLQNFVVDEISLDNDMGENQEEGRKIVLYMAEKNKWPNIVKVHTANPVARDYMLGMIERYKPD